MSYWKRYAVYSDETSVQIWNWAWVDGDAPAGGENGYPHAALIDPNVMPDQYTAPPPAPPAPVPADVNIPVVEYRDNWLPSYTGDFYFGPPGTSNSPVSLPPPSSPAYHVLLSSLRDADSNISAALKQAINGTDGYRELKEYVDRVKHWIFYRPEHSPQTDESFRVDMQSRNPSDPRYQYGQPGFTEDEKHFPPSQDALDAVKYLDNIMMGVGDSLLTAGMYLQRLYEAGEIYAKADKDSNFPTS